MKRWVQNPYLSSWIDYPQANVDRNPFVFSWQHDVSGAEVEHVMSFRRPETSMESDDPREVTLRVACHYLVDLVSEKGLPELLDSLRDNIEFYSAREQCSPNLPTTTQVRARIGETYDRPVFQLEE